VDDRHVEHRRDQADVRQARRLVVEELRSVWNHATGLVERGYPTGLPSTLMFFPDEQWRANRAVLARHLPDNEWDALSPFMDSIPATRAIVLGAPAGVPMTPANRERFAETAEIAADIYSRLSGGDDVAG
jgi:hypothetical protein